MPIARLIIGSLQLRNRLPARARSDRVKRVLHRTRRTNTILWFGRSFLENHSDPKPVVEAIRKFTKIWRPSEIELVR